MLTLAVVCIIVAAIVGIVVYVTHAVKPRRVKFTADVWTLVNVWLRFAVGPGLRLGSRAGAAALGSPAVVAVPPGRNPLALLVSCEGRGSLAAGPPEGYRAGHVMLWSRKSPLSVTGRGVIVCC